MPLQRTTLRGAKGSLSPCATFTFYAIACSPPTTGTPPVTFNCGIGMVLAVPNRDIDDIMIRLSGLHEQAFVIGEIAKCEHGKECVELL